MLSKGANFVLRFAFFVKLTAEAYSNRNNANEGDQYISKTGCDRQNQVATSESAPVIYLEIERQIQHQCVCWAVIGSYYTSY